MSKRKEMTGLRFGRLLVTEYAGNHLRGGRPRACWKVQCDCGNTKVIDGNALRTGNSKSCGCTQVEYRHGANNAWYTGGKLKAEYTRQKHVAETDRELSFTLTLDEVERLFSYPCFYCAAEPVEDNRGLVRNGIDRMDNSVGYEVDNVVACCTDCNLMKKDMTVEEFINHLKKILTHLGA